MNKVIIIICHFSDFRVDIVENLFTDFSEFSFCGIYEVIGEVVFMVFQVTKRLLFCDLFCTVVDVELLGDRFCYQNDVGGVGASFLVDGCDAVPQEFVVLRLVKLVKVQIFYKLEKTQLLVVVVVIVAVVVVEVVVVLSLWL